MQEIAPVVATMDLGQVGALYRVFLLASTLQVDMSFWSYDEYGGRGNEPFAVVYGQAPPESAGSTFDPSFALDMGWLYALHARSALARGRVWQALYMINGLREQLVSCLTSRAGLNPVQGRGVDELPATLLLRLQRTIPTVTTEVELRAAYRAELEMLGEDRPELREVLAELLSTSVIAIEDADLADQ